MTDYDITFCEGHGCTRRGICHRYMHLLEYRADRDPDKETLISMKLPPHHPDCGMYWEEKGE